MTICCYTESVQVLVTDKRTHFLPTFFTFGCYGAFNSLPCNKILDWSKSKAFADDKIKVTEKQKFFLGWVENIAGKGENAGYQHFLLFPQCFQKVSYTGWLKVRIGW